MKINNKARRFYLRNCFRSYFIIQSAIIFVLFSISLSDAKMVTFEKEYTYQASEIDSKVTARVIAVEQVKRLVLEELGTYLLAETEVRDFRLTKDKVVMLTAGIVQTEILNEKWDGEKYYLKAKIKADPNEVAASVDSLRKDTEKTKELEDVKKKADDAFKEIERLKKELEAVKADKNKQKEYAKAADTLSATDLFEKGYRYSLNNEDYKAIETYSSAIALDPNLVPAYNNRGLAYNNKGQNDRAIEDYNKAIQLSPNIADLYNNRGLAYNNKGQNDRAIEDYNKAIQLNPNIVSAYYNRGNSYFNKGQYDRAIEDYNKAIALDENNAKAYNNRGVVYFNKGQYDRAIEDYNKAIVLDPNNAMAYRNRGRIYNKKSQYNIAIADYSKAIEIDPNFAIAYVGRGFAYADKGQDDRAIQDFKIAAQLGDMDAQKFLRDNGIAWETKTVKTTNKEKYDKGGLSAKDWLERGIALSNSGKKSEAIDALSKAIELNPEEKLAYSYRGYAYAATKNFQKALDDFNTLVDIDPQDAETFHGRAFIYTQMGDYTRSFSDFELAFSKKPDSPIILAGLYSGRGFNYIKLHKYSEAIAEYSKAIELNPSVGMFYIGRAMAYRALKNYQKAIEDYDRVVFVDPQMSDAYYERGILKMEVGNREKGIEDFKKAAKLNHKEAQKKLNALGIDWLADSKTDSTLKSEISKESQEKYLYNPQPHAVQKLEYAPFLFEIRGCKAATDSITCDLVVINKGNKDRGLGISNGVYLLKKGIFSDTKTKPTRIVDNFGNEHKATLIQFGGKKEEKPQTLLVKDIPVRAVLIFDNISPLPSKLTLVEVALFDDKDNIVTLRFSNIAVHDIKD